MRLVSYLLRLSRYTLPPSMKSPKRNASMLVGIGVGGAGRAKPSPTFWS